MIRTVIFITLLFLLEAAFAPFVQSEVSPVNRYDANGSLVSGDGKYYEYNEANQLVRVRENDHNGTVIAEYLYDHSGQRVKKVENGVTTYYIGKHFETKAVEGRSEDISYVFANGERVTKTDSTGIYFYHPDHLGGTNAVTNVLGNVVVKNSYLPFGEIREGGQEKYSYTGKEKDNATDLYYFEARYNHPEFRHFTQADEVEPNYEDPQDLNRYAYVGNNPLSFVDPDGHKKKTVKLSKREKWMIAHGVNPDKDKTSLKEAKKQKKEGKKYFVTVKFNNTKSTGVNSKGTNLGATQVDDIVSKVLRQKAATNAAMISVASDMLYQNVELAATSIVLNSAVDCVINYAKNKYVWNLVDGLSGLPISSVYDTYGMYNTLKDGNVASFCGIGIKH